MANSVNRSAKTGRFVSGAYAKRHPGTTQSESVGSGTRNTRAVVRDVGTGQFTDASRAKTAPTRTVTQRV